VTALLEHVEGASVGSRSNRGTGCFRRAAAGLERLSGMAATGVDPRDTRPTATVAPG
jgi:hypothetical protein